MARPLLIGKGVRETNLLPSMTTRHGLIAGATGTGKTVTLKVMAEGLSSAGVPVFMADVKGDLASIAMPGSMNEKLKKRLEENGLPEPSFSGFPVTLWDLFGKEGHPVRATISDMGPLLLGRLLNLNDTQSAVLQVVFKAADDNGLLLLDLKDLRAMLEHAAEHAKELKATYGNISAASIGAIQRALITLEEQGAINFFGEPMLDIDDMLQSDSSGKGVINILAATTLIEYPMLYSTFLLWLLSEVYERMPEAGDLEKPKLAFFFDWELLYYLPKSTIFFRCQKNLFGDLFVEK